ncbi:MAG: hypothetical protein ACSHX8_14660 [Opitutaceae bacterium]
MNKQISSKQQGSHQMCYVALITLLGIFLFAGCASVDSKPFVKYNNALSEAQSGVDSAMAINLDWTRSGFVEGFSSDSNARFSQLILNPDDTGAWSSSSAPVYLEVKKTRSALNELNQSFSDYAKLLVQLSDGELVNTDTFDQIAADLNSNATDALASLNVSSPNGSAIFSTAASELARLYIEKKRVSYLKDALEENQSNIEAYTSLSVNLIHTIRGSMQAYYVDRYEPIKDGWNASKGEKRQKYTNSMLKLNEQYVDALSVLKQLEKTYGKLPQAHADLAKGIGEADWSLDGIQDLYSSARRLQRLHKELVETNEK